MRTIIRQASQTNREGIAFVSKVKFRSRPRRVEAAPLRWAERGRGLLTTTGGTITGWFVSPTGSAGNDGSIGSPWSLTHAMSGAGGVIQPGDTVWIRGGSYTGGVLNVSAAGTSGNVIKFRGYQRERVRIQRRFLLTPSAAQYLRFQDLELENTSFTAGDQDLAGFHSASSVGNFPGMEIINCIVHDWAGNGIGQWSEQTAALCYGTIVYNNGWYGSTPTSFGHGIYAQNTTTTRHLIQENIVFNNFGFGFHLFSSSITLRYLTLLGNVTFDNGMVGEGGGKPDITIQSGTLPIDGHIVDENMTWRTGNDPLFFVTLRLGDPSDQIDSSSCDVLCRNNYFTAGCQFHTWHALKVTGNTFYKAIEPQLGISEPGISVWPSSPQYDWNNNTYYGVTQFAARLCPSPPAAPPSFNFWSVAQWKSTTGYDASSTFNGTGTESGTLVLVRPNAYEAGRANIVIYNWADASSASVDLSSVLVNGDGYKIYNVISDPILQSPVATGTYSGAISLSLTASQGPAVTVDSGWATRHGMSPLGPLTVPKKFGCFVVRKD